MPRQILHVDMDSFFVAVEVLDDPSLTGKPVIVGGSGARGVVASCSYEARVYGVHSAMPSVRARRLCPDAIFLPGDYDRYVEKSQELHAVFDDFTPLVESLGLDEAFLDVTGARRLFGEGRSVAERVRTEVRERTGLEASVGVAPVKMLAKMASVAAKPTIVNGRVEPGPGVFVVHPGDELAFLHPKPIRALWGVGPATEKKLERLGVRTVGDVAAVPPQSLVAAVGTAAGMHLHELANGVDPRPVQPRVSAKSMGHEETYPVDIVDPESLHREALRLSNAVSARLRDEGKVARTITIKIRYGDFATFTRSRTVMPPIHGSEEVLALAGELLGRIDTSPGVRLFGVSASNLEDAPAEQLRLDERRARNVDHTIDRIRSRFGSGAVGSAALLDQRGLRTKQKGSQQWGPAD